MDTPQAAGPEPVRRVIEGTRDADPAIESVLAAAKVEVAIFDLSPAHLAARGFGRPERAALLRTLLHASRNHRLRIALHETQGIEGELPRLLQLLGQYSGQMFIHRTSGSARDAMDPLILADDACLWHRLHAEHPRSVLVLHNPADCRALHDRFEQIWENSEHAVSGSPLGL
jgi:hypothetical protein